MPWWPNTHTPGCDGPLANLSGARGSDVIGAAPVVNASRLFPFSPPSWPLRCRSGMESLPTQLWSGWTHREVGLGRLASTIGSGLMMPEPCTVLRQISGQSGCGEGRILVPLQIPILWTQIRSAHLYSELRTILRWMQCTSYHAVYFIWHFESFTLFKKVSPGAVDFSSHFSPCTFLECIGVVHGGESVALVEYHLALPIVYH